MKALERQFSYAAFLHELRSASTRVRMLAYAVAHAPFTVARTLTLPHPDVADGLMPIRDSRMPGRDKGDAMRAILMETNPDAAVAYLGDDQTDEDAFRALKGRGLTALVRPESRPTAADIWLQPPQELIEFFDDWLHAVGGEQ